MKDKQPGVMLYFELRPGLRRLNNEQKGLLFSAILDYAQEGTEPEFEDPVVSTVWDFIKPSIDRDTAAYAGKVERAKNAANRRWAMQKQHEGNADESNGIQSSKAASGEVPNMPTPTTTPIPAPTPTPTSTPIPAPVPTTTPAPTTASAPNGDMAPRAASPTTGGRGDEISDETKVRAKTKRFVPPTLEEVTEFVRSRNSPVDPQEFIDFYASKGWVIGKSPMKDWKAACRNAESWERWKNRPPKRETFPGEEELDPYDVIGLLRARGELYE